MMKINKKKIKRAIRKNKPMIFLAALFLFVSVGGTIAHFYTQQVVQSGFKTADYNISLSEYFPISEWDSDNTLDKQVKVSNNGTGDVLLRVSYNEMWFEDGDVVNNLYEGNEIVTKNWTAEFKDNFTYKDGWYYYNKVLERESSVTIMDSVVRNYDVYDETSEYHLDFNYEVVQVENDAATEVWGMSAEIEGSNVVWS